MTTAHSGSGDLNRSLQLLWQGREQPSRGPRPGLTLDGIVAAAVALADREGLAALSMRKVAAELGVGTMSLYRYVPGKGELLDLMLDHVNGVAEGDMAAHEGKGWRERLELVGLGSFALYERHPWLIQVNQSRPLLGPNGLLGFDLALAALDGLGLSGQAKVTVITVLDSFVTGLARAAILQRQAAEASGISDEEFWEAQAPLLISAMESGCYPHVFQLEEDSFSVGHDAILRFGLARILDGLEAFIEGSQQEGRGRQRT